MMITRKIGIEKKVLLAAAVVFLFIVLFLNPSISADESAGQHEHVNHMGLFLGNSHRGGETGFSIGFDYEHRVSDLFGFGALVEYAGGDFDSWVLAAPLYIHPYKGFRFLAAPGFEDEESETKFLIRAGVAYQIPFGGRWAISPEYNVDFIEGGEKIQVYGVSIGLGF